MSEEITQTANDSSVLVGDLVSEEITRPRPTLKQLVDEGRLEPMPERDPKVVQIPRRMCRPLPNERTGEILIFTGVTRVYTDVEPPCDV